MGVLNQHFNKQIIETQRCYNYVEPTDYLKDVTGVELLLNNCWYYQGKDCCTFIYKRYSLITCEICTRGAHVVLMYAMRERSHKISFSLSMMFHFEWNPQPMTQRTKLIPFNGYRNGHRTTNYFTFFCYITNMLGYE